MIYTPKTKQALNLMFEKHKEQKDAAGQPYVFHPFHLAESMDTEDETIVALLHDIIEDTNLTLNDLKKKDFSDTVIKCISILTHDKTEDYFDYIKRISTNKIATKVKIADLKHNTDLSRLDYITEYDKLRNKKYILCLKYLEDIYNKKYRDQEPDNKEKDTKEEPKKRN